MNKHLLSALMLAATLPATGDESAPAAPKAESPEVVNEDFSKLAAGKLPDELMVVEGEFEIVEDGGNKILTMKPEPLAEGGVLLGKSLKAGGTMKAKIKATNRKRSYPKFGVGIGGTSGYRFRIVPAEKLVEIVKEDERLASAECSWKSDAWHWVEFSALAGADGKWALEGRLWEDGQPRPEKPTLTLAAGVGSSGKCSVWGTPYSGTPILFDDIEITPAK